MGTNLISDVQSLRAAAAATTRSSEPLRVPRGCPEAVWPFSTVSLRVDDENAAVTSAGIGPALLFVHIGLCSIIWRDVMSVLAADFRCVCLDAPGTGLSERLPPGRIASCREGLLPSLTATRGHETYMRGRRVQVKYTTLRRYVRQAGLWKQPRSTVRMAPTAPDEVAEMDFETLGTLVIALVADARWCTGCLVVLVYSRYAFLWPLEQQTVEATIEGVGAGVALLRRRPAGATHPRQLSGSGCRT
jgi:hypothetical protein